MSDNYSVVELGLKSISLISKPILFLLQKVASQHFSYISFYASFFWYLFISLSLILYYSFLKNRNHISFFLYLFYQLEANYFTILQWFLSYIDMNQPWIYMYSPSRSPHVSNYTHFSRCSQVPSSVLCVHARQCPTYCSPMDYNPPGSSVH